MTYPRTAADDLAALRVAARAALEAVRPMLARLPCQVPGRSRPWLPTGDEMVWARTALEALERELAREVQGP